MRGRNVFSNISYLVDSIFTSYLSRPGVRQPIFTSYCNGSTVTCNGLSQWGSKYLGDQGYSAIEIIRYYYGSDMYINTATSVSGVPSSWPGYNLSIGARGDKVRQIQQQLNRIAQNYPAIPTVSADGIYGRRTAEAVRSFQQIFGLPVSGIVDYPTWYKISAIYVAVTRISEPGTWRLWIRIKQAGTFREILQYVVWFVKIKCGDRHGIISADIIPAPSEASVHNMSRCDHR